MCGERPFPLQTLMDRLTTPIAKPAASTGATPHGSARPHTSAFSPLPSSRSRRCRSRARRKCSRDVSGDVNAYWARSPLHRHQGAACARSREHREAQSDHASATTVRGRQGCRPPLCSAVGSAVASGRGEQYHPTCARGVAGCNGESGCRTAATRQRPFAAVIRALCLSE